MPANRKAASAKKPKGACYSSRGRSPDRTCGAISNGCFLTQAAALAAVFRDAIEHWLKKGRTRAGSLASFVRVDEQAELPCEERSSASGVTQRPRTGGRQKIL